MKSVELINVGKGITGPSNSASGLSGQHRRLC